MIVPILYPCDFFQRKTMATEDQERAEARFHKTIKKSQEAKQAISQYEVDARAVAEKTAKLRALRLAKEAAEAKEAAARTSPPTEVKT
jgi:wobble nucleotide-excising tRNase